MLGIRRTQDSDTIQCQAIAASLPDYFSAEDAAEIARDVVRHAGWVAESDAHLLAFIVVDRRSAEAVEITWLATELASHRQGIGAALLTHVLADLSRDGVRLVEVKTLDASADYAPYESTRRFWQRHGFVQIDTIEQLPGWRPGNPAAIFVAALTTTR